MSTSSKRTKRKLTQDALISPPPLKRKISATTTQSAVSSFFTPTSQKPPERIQWQERRPNDDVPSSLLVGKYTPLGDSSAPTLKRDKIAAFDFDSTLIDTSSGKKFSSDAQDWKWWHASVPGRLRKMYLEDGIVVISNQGGLSLHPDSKAPKGRMTTFKSKVSAVLTQLDLPVSIYAATEKDKFRKPRTGIWAEFLDDYDIQKPSAIDLQNSIFVGDAGGRPEGSGKSKDFSCSDRNFAENVGIKFYTPEEFFLEEAPRPFTRTFEPHEYLAGSTAEAKQDYTKKNDLDIVLFCGSPGAGKSTFYFNQLEPLGYTRVNQDILKTREKCLKVASQELANGNSIVVDNTNADVEVRKEWVKLAARHNVPVRCVLFTTPPSICEHNDVVRALNDVMNPEKRTILPGMAFSGFAKRYQQPQLMEGFQDITEVAFKFSGTDIERSIWSRYWT